MLFYFYLGPDSVEVSAASLVPIFLNCNWLISFTANEFPSSFESIVRKIVRLLFHVVAHLYAAHFKEVVMLGLHAHLNLTFAHLTALQNRFSLIEPKETEVLRDLEVALRLTEDSCQDVTNQDQSEHSDVSEMDCRIQGDRIIGKMVVLWEISLFLVWMCDSYLRFK